MFPTQHPTWDTFDSEVEGRGRSGEACVSPCYASFYLYRANQFAIIKSIYVFTAVSGFQTTEPSYTAGFTSLNEDGRAVKPIPVLLQREKYSGLTGY